MFNIAANVQVTISAVTISGGNAGDSTQGCTPFPLRSCPAENGLDGGGIANAGTLTLTNSVVTGNATAAGTLPFSPFIILCVPNCPPAAGSSAGGGGNGAGIYNAPNASLTIASSSVSANKTGAGGSGTNGFSGSGTMTGAGQPGGSGGFGGSGGGIFNDSGATLTITNSVLAGNATGAGGNAGSGSDSLIGPGAGGNAGFPQSAGFGAAIFNLGTLTVSGSTLSGNATGAGGNGGTGGTGSGAPNGQPSASAGGGFGGALFNETSLAVTTTLTNDTIAGNSTGAGGTGGASNGAGGNGGGIDQFVGGPVVLTFDTVANNQAAGNAGGLLAGAGAIFEANSIVASNAGAPGANCNGSVADHGGNVVFGQTSCPGTVGDPRLGPLASNGGPTQTMALGPGSTAVSAVPINTCAPAVDQRGVARPQGPACDAGAYELAPPAFSSATAIAASTTTAAVNALVNPNLRDTAVTVHYGTTTAYGSTTTAQDVGAGGAAAAFATTLGGLSPGTTYHAQIVAANADGTTASSDITFTTEPPLAAALSSTSASGDQLKLTITCDGGDAGQECSGAAKLTSHVTSHGGSAVAVAAAAKKKPKPKGTTKVETVGSARYSVASGKSIAVRITLNATGKLLLERFYKVPATLEVSGTSALAKKVTLAYALVTSPITFTWGFGSSTTTAQQLTVSKIPKNGKVDVICSGGGCPFATRTFAPKHGKVALASQFKRGLRPRATVEIVISAPNSVAKVAVFTIERGTQPTVADRCLPPGAKKPARCASSP